MAAAAILQTFPVMPTAAAPAADMAEVMGTRYLRYELCMEKAFGKGAYARLGIATAINGWSVAEPRATSLALQPPSVLKVDAECRKANQLSAERRPE